MLDSADEFDDRGRCRYCRITSMVYSADDRGRWYCRITSMVDIADDRVRYRYCRITSMVYTIVLMIEVDGTAE